MTETILKMLLEASATAGTAALIVMLLRIPMKKAPKFWSYMLWAVVFFRCLCPFAAESPFSLFNIVPDGSFSSEISEASYGTSGTDHITVYYRNAEINDEHFDRMNNSSDMSLSKTSPDNKPSDIIFGIWASGAAVMLLYAVISYIRLMTKVKTAVRTEDGVYETDLISTAFSAGLFHPRIYIPCGLFESERRLIVAHEKIHIRRHDLIAKALAFAALSLHWFNPLIWAAFALMTKDMELSCDEAVLKKLGSEEKRAYSQALLSVSMKQSGISALPIAFAETGVKDRVKNVLGYEKPRTVGTALSAVTVISACAVLGTNAVSVSSEAGSVLVEGTAELAADSAVYGEMIISEASGSEAVTYAAEEPLSDTVEEYISYPEPENNSYAVYAYDEDHAEKSYDVLIAYADGTMEEFSIVGDRFFGLSDLGSTEICEAADDDHDSEYRVSKDTVFEYGTSEYPVYITVDEAVDSVGEKLVTHSSGEYTMCTLYEPYGMYYDYQKNCYVYNDEPVRFFYDPIEKASFTNYFIGTKDLEAVYENDVLVSIKECSDEVYAIHDEKQVMLSSVLPATSIVVLPDASLVMV